MPELVKHSSRDLHCDQESQHAGAHPEISNRNENTHSLFTKYFELEEMFEKTCYPLKSEKERSSMKLNLSKQEFFPSHHQHTEVRKGISKVENDQKVPSTSSSINHVQLKDESCYEDLRNNVLPEYDDNDNQLSLSALISARESGFKDRMNLEEGHLSRKILTPRGMNHRKRKYVEEQDKSIKERPTVLVKAPIKEAWIVNKPNKRNTIQVRQEKTAELSGMSSGPEITAFIKDSETPNIHKLSRKSNTMKDIEVLVRAPADVVKQAEFSNNGDTEASKLDNRTAKGTPKSPYSHGQVDRTDASLISVSNSQEAVPEEVPINAPPLHRTINNTLELIKSRSLQDLISDVDAVYNTISPTIVQRNNITNLAVENKIGGDGAKSDIIGMLTPEVIIEEDENMDVVSTSMKALQPLNIMGQNAIKILKLKNGKVLHLFINKNSKISLPLVKQNKQISGTAESVASNMHLKGDKDLNNLEVSQPNLEGPLEVDTDKSSKEVDWVSFDVVGDCKKGMELESIDNVKEREESAVDTRVFISEDSLVPKISPCQETRGIIKEPETETLKAPTKGKMKMPEVKDVSSVRVINGKPFDFRCTICKNLPREINRSELYRHYATQHFQRALTQEFGHLKVCPYCNIELKGSVASHFGQKHSFVESYLPVKAWIPAGWRKTSGKMIRKRNKIKEPLRNEKCMWPEDLAGLDIEGPGSSKRCLNGRSTVVAIVDGFEIEHEKEIELDQVQVEKRFAIDRNEVVECRICKRVFEDEQASVMHLQSHGISVSGDVNSLIKAFLTNGYITLIQRSSVISYTSEVTSDSDPLSKGVIFDNESFLDEEELQLLKELNAKA